MSTGGSASKLRIIRFAQIGKILRITSLLRLRKISRILGDVMDRRMSETQAVLFKCTMVVVAVLWLNHLVGCAWFALGRYGPSDTGFHWIQMTTDASGVSLDFMDSSGPYQYITSMHWALAQLTMGAVEVMPTNSMERLFNVCCLAGGLIFGSTLISSLSATMVDFQMAQKTRKFEIRKLRKFLRESGISEKLALRVEKHAAERLSVNERIYEKDVSALQKISKSMLAEVRCEMVMPCLNRHPLFRMLTTCDSVVMRRICTDATRSLALLPCDELFCAGASTDSAYYLHEGKLDYHQSPLNSPVDTATSRCTHAGSWISEASLWSHWMHVGTAKALSTCQLFVISADGVQAALGSVQSLKQVTAEYCRQFHKRIVVARPPLTPWPDDLHVPHTEFDDLVMSMKCDTRTDIGLWAMEYVAKCQDAHSFIGKRFSDWRLANRLEKLREEVQSGVSCVVLNESGQLERIVPVVVLRAEARDEKVGKVLVELGKVQHKSGEVKLSCQPPACKQEKAETRAQALDRLLGTLGLKSHRSKAQQVERIADRRESTDLGVETKYLRTVYALPLREDDLDLPTLTTARDPQDAGGPANADEQVGCEEFRYERFLAYKAFHGDKTVFYAWLPPTTFHYLSSPGGGRDLIEWLVALQNAEERQTIGI